MGWGGRPDYLAWLPDAAQCSSWYERWKDDAEGRWVGISSCAETDLGGNCHACAVCGRRGTFPFTGLAEHILAAGIGSLGNGGRRSTACSGHGQHGTCPIWGILGHAAIHGRIARGRSAIDSWVPVSWCRMGWRDVDCSSSSRQGWGHCIGAALFYVLSFLCRQLYRPAGAVWQDCLFRVLVTTCRDACDRRGRRTSA